jgi:hypothetical protein
MINISIGPWRKAWLHSWWVTSLHFLTQCPAHVSVSWSSLVKYRQLDAGCLCLRLQTDRSWTPIFRNMTARKRPFNQIPRVFLQLQTWLCVAMFCKEMIFNVSYMWIDVLMLLIIVAMKVWTVTVTSPLVHINNCDLLVQWPHNFHTHFSSHCE